MKIIEQTRNNFTEQPRVFKFFQQGARLSDTAGNPLTQAQVENPADTTFGTVSGERIWQAIIKWASTVTSVFNGIISGYKEKSEVVTFTAGAASVDISTAENILDMSLTQNSVLTFTNPVKDKPIDLAVTHTDGPWTLSLNSTDLGLEGAAGETEYLTARYTGAVYHVFRAGIVDVTI